MDAVRLKKSHKVCMEETMNNQSALANPAPLGLLGFGMTTVLLNIHNAGIIEISLMIVGMGIALGGLAQIIAGILEYRAGNTFGGTAFTAYGCFWWSLVIIWMMPGMTPADETSMGFYLLLWAIFTAGMFIGALRHNNITKVVFGSLTILFLLLSIGDLTGIAWIKTVAGIEGIFCGFSAIYSALGQVINHEYGKELVRL